MEEMMLKVELRSWSLSLSGPGLSFGTLQMISLLGRIIATYHVIHCGILLDPQGLLLCHKGPWSGVPGRVEMPLHLGPVVGERCSKLGAGGDKQSVIGWLHLFEAKGDCHFFQESTHHCSSWWWSF